MNKYPKRKITRLNEYNYTQAGYYYVTICADNRQELFGNIKQNQMVLNKYGEIVEIYIQDISNKYPNAKLDTYIIMPNHVHIIIQIVGAIHESLVSNQIQINNQKNIDNSNRAIRELPLRIKRRKMLLSKMVGYIKMRSAKQINILRNTTGKSLWQRFFYDHVIGNDKSLYEIREYIVNNPATWDNDKHNPK
ncbi:MAG: transposase [Candidatus Omnitrophota bacterium]|nr:MAG: transposase [Candidatus Omnitrophota bacterium]